MNLITYQVQFSFKQKTLSEALQIFYVTHDCILRYRCYGGLVCMSSGAICDLRPRLSLLLHPLLPPPSFSPSIR